MVWVGPLDYRPVPLRMTVTEGLGRGGESRVAVEVASGPEKWNAGHLEKAVVGRRRSLLRRDCSRERTRGPEYEGRGGRSGDGA